MIALLSTRFAFDHTANEGPVAVIRNGGWARPEYSCEINRQNWTNVMLISDNPNATFAL
jgi:hypothetical protein